MGTDTEYILDAILKLGYSKERILGEALDLFLLANKDLREKVALELYKEGKVSLGKASEIARLSYEEMKSLLLARGIEIRRGPESVTELREKTKKLLNTL